MDWLDRHDADTSAADALVDSAITEEMLDRLAGSIDGERLQVALNVLVAECAAHQLVTEIQTAAARIYKLVAAVKGFTYMDQATLQKPVDIGQGLSDTLTVLNQKARARSIVVTLEIEPDLPHVMGLGGGLNQVWANLVDNAIDAAAATVLVSACAPGPRGRGPRRRRRGGYRAGCAAANLRPVLHDQAHRRRHRPWPRHRAPAGDPAPWRHQRELAPGPHRVHRNAADRSGKI